MSSFKTKGHSSPSPPTETNNTAFSETITPEILESFPISWRWWALLTSPIILFSISVATYSYLQTTDTNELITLNSVNILVLLFWLVITVRSLKSPFITLSKSEIMIKDFLGGQTRVLNWNEIEEIKYGEKHLLINTKHQESITIPKRFLNERHYESLFAQLRSEIKQKHASVNKIGRYGIIMNGKDAYVTYDCFGTFSKITELTSYLKRKKDNKSIRRIYICINGNRKRFLYRITDKNISNAINDAAQKKIESKNAS